MHSKLRYLILISVLFLGACTEDKQITIKLSEIPNIIKNSLTQIQGNQNNHHSNDKRDELIISEVSPVIKKMNLVLDAQGIDKNHYQGIKSKYLSYATMPNCRESKSCTELVITYTDMDNCINQFLGGKSELGFHDYSKDGGNIRNIYNTKIGHVCYSISTDKKSNAEKIIQALKKADTKYKKSQAILPKLKCSNRVSYWDDDIPSSKQNCIYSDGNLDGAYQKFFADSITDGSIMPKSLPRKNLTKKMKYEKIEFKWLNKNKVEVIQYSEGGGEYTKFEVIGNTVKIENDAAAM